jgi:hypothetical protein
VRIQGVVHLEPKVIPLHLCYVRCG